MCDTNLRKSPHIRVHSASLLHKRFLAAMLLTLSFCLQYFIYCCILGLVSCSVFLRINYELKMVVMLVAVVIYNIIILQTHASLLDGFSKALYPTDTLDRYLHTKLLSTLSSNETIISPSLGRSSVFETLRPP